MFNSTFDGPGVHEAPIAHVDLDAFFASVEILDDPSLRGRPVAVGGAGERGVIASASYEARRFGVSSAMPSVIARRRCPSLIILPGRFERYSEVSRRFHEMIGDVTPHVEPIGLDEAFLDLRSLGLLRVDPIRAVSELRERIRTELQLLSGVGLARNKLFAKLASRRAKPSVRNGRLVDGPGVLWVSPELEVQWLNELEVRSLWGVGPATNAKLAQLGVRYVRELAMISQADLERHFGPSLGATLAAYATGDDPREVITARAQRSVGHDQTFATSLAGVTEVRRALIGHAGVVGRALRRRREVARTISVVARFDDLQSVSRAQTLAFGIDDVDAIYSVAEALVSSIDLSRSTRLLGLYASNLSAREDNAVQLRFDLPDEGTDDRSRALRTSHDFQVSREALRDVVDDIRRRFGTHSLASAGELTSEGIEVSNQRSSHPFGPEPRSEP